MNDPVICPKCGFEQPAAGPACLRCGIVFEKLRQRRERDPAVDVQAASRQAGVALRDLFLPAAVEENSLIVWSRAVIFVLLLAWGSRLIFSGIASNYAGETLLHLVNLPFHEAGHILFRPFGRFMTSLGGTLGQLLVPLVCLLVLLLKTRDPFGAAVCLWWLGENFLDIAPYLNDARAGKLPLLGGNFGHSAPFGFHDWEFILTRTGLLRYDHYLAMASHIFGSLVMGTALLWAGLLLLRRMRRP